MINKKVVTGLICECNPFHEGHKRIINEAKKISHYLVCIMSPDFVQRGEPAIYDKYERTKKLLENGADLVIELPIEFALSSAKYFSKSAIYIFNKLNFVDNLIFGSYINDVIELKNISKKIISILEANGNNDLKKYLQEGFSYQKAILKALDKNLSSNDILGVEYLIALNELKSNIKPITIERKNDLPTASEIRQKLKSKINLDLFSDYLNSLLFFKVKNNETFLDYYNIDLDFNNRLCKNIKDNLSFTERVNLLTTKNRTYAFVKRNLLHILFNIKKDYMKNHQLFTNYNYIRILGFKENSKEILDNVKIPYLLGYTKKSFSDFNDKYYDYTLNESIKINIYASDLYQYVLKSGKSEATSHILKI